MFISGYVIYIQFSLPNQLHQVDKSDGLLM